MPSTEKNFLSYDFALTYEAFAEQLTGPFSKAALLWWVTLGLAFGCWM